MDSPTSRNFGRLRAPKSGVLLPILVFWPCAYVTSFTHASPKLPEEGSVGAQVGDICIKVSVLGITASVLSFL